MTAISTALSPLQEQSRTVPLTTFEPDELFFSITDNKGLIEHANSVFTRLSGYDFEEMRAQPHNIVRDPAMPKGAFRLIWNEIQAGRPVASYVANRTRTGERYEVFAVMLPSPNGYISIRLRPETGGLRDTIFALFDRARAVEEATEGGTREQADAGASFLLSELQALGIPDMATLTKRTLPREVAATINALPDLEYTASREPLEILPGKIRMVGKLVLGPLRSLETVDLASQRVYSSIFAEASRAEAIMALATTIREVADTLAWGESGATGGSVKELSEVTERAIDQLHRGQARYQGAIERATTLRESVEELAQNIGIFALQNQMIGRFAVELTGGSVAEPPGSSMRLLHAALATQLSLVTSGATEVNSLAQATPEMITRAGRDLGAIMHALMNWCNLAEQMVSRQGAAVAPDVAERVRSVRAAVQEGIELPAGLQELAEELGRVNVQIEEMPLQATIKFIGMVTAEIQ